MKNLVAHLLCVLFSLPALSQQADTIKKTDATKFRCLPPVMPVPGYNKYDGFQLGIGFGNFLSGKKKFIFYGAPAYAFNSKKITGYAGASYLWDSAFTQPIFRSIELGINGGTFSINEGRDSGSKKIFADVYRIAPRIRFTFNAPADVENYLELKVYIIGERNFDYLLSSQDSLYHPVRGKTKVQTIREVNYSYAKIRKLFPYDFSLRMQDAKSFYRINANMHYFFNYLNKGGVQMRLFASKFGYIGGKTPEKTNETLRYQPKLTAVTGYEDYTYSNYFIGRNEFDGFASQQVMMRDGGLKLRTDLFQDLQGKSDDWVASMNLNTTIPGKIIPKNFPLKIFLDVGTYAGLWKKDSPDSRFLYVAGLQLSVLKDLLNVYVPVMYSKKFRDNLSSVPEENKLLKKISFSIDIHRLNLRRFNGLNTNP